MIFGYYCGSSWNSAVIRDNSVEATISSTSVLTGGFIASFEDGSDCLVTKNSVEVDMTIMSDIAGGFVARIRDSNQLVDNYVLGTINANSRDNVGGFVGNWIGSDDIENAFSVVEITNPGSTNIGVFTAYFDGGLGDCIGCLVSDINAFVIDASPSSGATLESDALMQDSATYIAEGFDFTNVWTMGTRYPILRD